MARFGINPEGTLGASIPTIRNLAKTIGKDHELALSLWKTGIHEARILASLVDDPTAVTERQMESWVKDFDSWDICDQVCSNLFGRTPFARHKVIEWSGREEEFVKRAGFVLVAALTVHDKKAEDSEFIAFLPMIECGSTDGRNFVKKAVNWALRQIGKRDAALNRAAIAACESIRKKDSPSARWIAADALRELRGEAVQRHLRVKRRIAR